MLIIGLTGGIGSGKTAVANYFAELGITIIDADTIAREIIATEVDILKKIVTHFGKNIVDKNNQLDRRHLREIIFANPLEREWLEQLLHPIISTQIQQRAQAALSPYCILVIPLLLEKGGHIKVDRILVVDAQEKLQAQRVQQRDQICIKQFNAIAKTQLGREERLQYANEVIENNGSLVDLKQQVKKLHLKYLELAK